MRHHSLEHRFVRTVPRELEPGELYVSMEYATVQPPKANPAVGSMRWLRSCAAVRR